MSPPRLPIPAKDRTIILAIAQALGAENWGQPDDFPFAMRFLFRIPQISFKIPQAAEDLSAILTAKGYKTSQELRQFMTGEDSCDPEEKIWCLDVWLRGERPKPRKRIA